MSWSRRVCLLVLVLLRGGVLCGLDLFENRFNYYSGAEIQTFHVLGERCSGTNYIMALLENNFPGQQVIGTKKHFMPWFDLSDFGFPKKTEEPQELSFLAYPTDPILVVVVVRDPYDWLRSFYANPWHVSEERMLNKGFLHFLKHEWRSDEKDPSYTGVDQWNPYQNRRFKNVLELRKYKTLNYLKIGMLSKNFLLIRYEEAAENPQEFIDFIANHYNIGKAKRFKYVFSYKNEKKKAYQKAAYKPFKANEFFHVNQEIDWAVEDWIGYQKYTSLDLLNHR